MWECSKPNAFWAFLLSFGKGVRVLQGVSQALVIIFFKSLGNMRSNLTTLIYARVTHNETWEEVVPIECAQEH